ncbi:MAG: hygromycin-B 7''-O-kinase [Myxococcota bacterium]|jgi:hygromycin-B 7''-O-kinase
MEFPPEHTIGTPLRSALPPSGWAVAMRRVLARHGLPDLGLAPFATGSDVVWGTRSHVVKLTHPRWSAEIEAEATLLRRMSGTLTVSVPEVVAHGAIDGWPYVVLGRLTEPSIGRVWPALTEIERRALARALGEAVAVLHGRPAEDDGSWAGWRAECVRTVGERHAPAPLAEGASEFALRHLGPDLPLVQLHTELLHDHVLVGASDRGWRPFGLIDFADGRVGDPHYELVAPVEFIWQGDTACTRAFLSGLGWTPTGPRTLLAWALVHRYGSLSRSVALAPGCASLDELAERVYGW